MTIRLPSMHIEFKWDFKDHLFRKKIFEEKNKYYWGLAKYVMH